MAQVLCSPRLVSVSRRAATAQAGDSIAWQPVFRDRDERVEFAARRRAAHLNAEPQTAGSLDRQGRITVSATYCNKTHQIIALGNKMFVAKSALAR